MVVTRSFCNSGEEDDPPAREVAVVSLDGVGVRLNRATLLDDISFDIGAGEFLTIVGPNGAGKTTLLRVLDRLIKPSTGTIMLEGQDLGQFGRRELARMVSFVPQTDLGGGEFTVRAFVEMGRYPYLGPWEPLGTEDRGAVEKALATTEVSHLGDRLLGTLSGGERQRTLIAAALAQGGKILLLDEPTSFLDYRHQVQVLDLLDHLNRKLGYTLVVVTHDLNATVGRSDSVLALKGGRVAFAGPPEGLLNVDRLASIYENDFELVVRSGSTVPIVVPSRGDAP